MAHNLITLLEGDTADTLVLQELRSMTRDGVDVRLIADILAKAHLVMRRLGLDPADTTAEEVYGALLSAVRTEQWLSLLNETEYVLLEVDDAVISFNPVDVVNNYHFELPIDKRQTTAAKRGLGWEITRRYQSHPQTNEERVTRAAERAKWPRRVDHRAIGPGRRCPSHPNPGGPPACSAQRDEDRRPSAAAQYPQRARCAT